MEPLDLRNHPPRGGYVELDGLMVMPRTIDKLRAMLPGGNAGEYFIDGNMQGISGYLLGRLGISEEEVLEVVRQAADEAEVAHWLRTRVDPASYPAINQTLRRIKPKHSQDPEDFRRMYADTMAAHPELECVIDIVDADDKRHFGCA